MSDSMSRLVAKVIVFVGVLAYFYVADCREAAQQGVQRMGFWAWLKMSFLSIAHR